MKIDYPPIIRRADNQIRVCLSMHIILSSETDARTWTDARSETDARVWIFSVPALHCVQLSSAWLPDPTPGL